MPGGRATRWRRAVAVVLAAAIVCQHVSASSYLKMPAGAPCPRCDQRIRTAADCKSAAAALGLGDTTVATGSWPNSPPGCSYVASDHLSFNFNLAASGEGTAGGAAICTTAPACAADDHQVHVHVAEHGGEMSWSIIDAQRGAELCSGGGYAEGCPHHATGCCLSEGAEFLVMCDGYVPAHCAGLASRLPLPLSAPSLCVTAAALPEPLLLPLQKPKPLSPTALLPCH